MVTYAIPQHPVQTTDASFADLGLSQPILDIITKIGFINPTPIQAAVIPIARGGRDVIGLAQTGSGKTAAFVIPIAERLTHGRGVRGLILSPTREIALQTKAFLHAFRANHELDTAWPLRGAPMPPLPEELGSTLVFTRRKIDAEWLYHILQRQGHPVTRIHADRSQSRRTEALQNFREGSHRILVATDIAGRGIDVPGITHVINFDIPESVDDYVHRAGRTARGAAQGIVSTIATWQDIGMVRQIEQILGEKIPRCTVAGVEPWTEMERPPARSRNRL